MSKATTKKIKKPNDFINFSNSIYNQSSPMEPVKTTQTSILLREDKAKTTVGSALSKLKKKAGDNTQAT